MGDDEQNWDDTIRIIHPVKLDSFSIGKYPVTQVLWKAVMNGENPSRFVADSHPIERVSWLDITKRFLPRLNEMTKDFRPKDTAYCLPTEAQWEYAAKGGKHYADFPFTYSGSNKLNEVSWYEDNSHNKLNEVRVSWYEENSHDETKPVGLKTSNLLGIHDMSGNVWEWSNDWYGIYEEVIEQSKKDTKTSAIVNPIGVEKGANRVRRGGSWDSYALGCRSASRDYSAPSFRDNHIGFRLVLVFPSVKIKKNRIE